MEKTFFTEYWHHFFIIDAGVPLTNSRCRMLIFDDFQDYYIFRRNILKSIF
jgi:hypothetical protein